MTELRAFGAGLRLASGALALAIVVQATAALGAATLFGVIG